MIGYKILKKDETKPTSQSTVDNNINNSEIKNSNTNEVNAIQNNAIQGNNTVDNNETQENETKPDKDPIAEAKTDEEKAIAIAKKETLKMRLFFCFFVAIFYIL